MADIVDAQAIRFCNEVVRPLAEKTRALYYLIRDMKTQWDGGIGTLFPADSSPVQDGREDEGVSRLTGWAVATCHDKWLALLATIETDGELNATLALPCVRALGVS